MPLKWANVTVPLTQGVETKADKRALQPPKLLVAENLSFDDIGGLQKRPGFDALSLTATGGTLDPQRIRALSSRGDELVLFAEGKVYSWGEADSKWLSRGPFESVHVEQSSPYVHPFSQQGADRAESAAFIAYTWQVTGSAGSVLDGVWWQMLDKTTGALVNHDGVQTTASLGYTAAGAGRMRKVGDSFHLYFVDAGVSPRHLLCIRHSTSAGLGAPTVHTIATDVHDGSQFDVSVDSANSVAFVAYRNTTSSQYTIKKVAAAGTVSTTSAKARSCTGNLAVSYDTTTGGLLVARHADKDADGGNDVMADWITAASLADAASVNVTVKASETPTDLTAVVYQSGANTVAWVLWNTTVSVSGITPGAGSPGGEITAQAVVKRASVTTGGSVGVKTLVRDSKLASRPVVWRDDTTDRVFVHVGYFNPHPDINLGSGTLQPQFVLLDVAEEVGNETAGSGTSKPLVVARALPGEAALHGVSGLVTGHLPQIDSIGSGVFAWVAPYTRTPRLRQGDPASPLFVTRWTYDAALSFKDIRYTFGDARAYRGVEAGEALYLPGGYLGVYDGDAVHEASFFTFPEGIDTETYNVSGTGPLTVATTYSYQFFWEHRNARGERVHSSFAGAVSVTTGASDDACRFVIPICPYTMRERVVLAVYRSEANPVEGAPHYRISDPAGGNTYVENDVNGTHVAFDDNTDTPTVTAMLNNEMSPISQGEFDTVPPGAPPQAVAAGQRRLFAVHPESRTRVVPSLLRSDGDEVSFNEDVEIVVPDAGGKVTALVALEDAVVCFKERAIYVVAGTGPDNLGQGGYGDAQLVSELVGCLDARTVVRIPSGILFKSEQGFYHMNQAYQLEFIGAAVEDYNGRTVTAAVAQPHRHRVLFLGAYDASDPYALAYDYLVGQWSVWTGPCGPSATIAKDTNGITQRAAYYVHEAASVTRSIRKERVSDFDDAGTNYAIDIETAWIKFDDLTGYVSVRWFEVLGEIRSTSTLRVQVAYNYVETWIDTVEFAVSGSAGAPMQMRRRFSQRKVQAVKFRITEGASGVASAGECFRLTGIAMQVGLKGGLYRLPAAQTE